MPETKSITKEGARTRGKATKAQALACYDNYFGVLRCLNGGTREENERSAPACRAELEKWAIIYLTNPCVKLLSQFRDRAGAPPQLVEKIPDGEENREVEIEARESGLVIDDYITIGWDWLLAAYLASSLPKELCLKNDALPDGPCEKGHAP